MKLKFDRLPPELILLKNRIFANSFVAAMTTLRLLVAIVEFYSKL